MVNLTERKFSKDMLINEMECAQWCCVAASHLQGSWFKPPDNMLVGGFTTVYTPKQLSHPGSIPGYLAKAVPDYDNDE